MHLPLAGVAEPVIWTPKLDRLQTLRLDAASIDFKWMTNFWTSPLFLSGGI